MIILLRNLLSLANGFTVIGAALALLLIGSSLASLDAATIMLAIALPLIPNLVGQACSRSLYERRLREPAVTP